MDITRTKWVQPKQALQFDEHGIAVVEAARLDGGDLGGERGHPRARESRAATVAQGGGLSRRFEIARGIDPAARENAGGH
jgi:hypothetical protein